MKRPAAPLLRVLGPDRIGPVAAELVFAALDSRRNPVIGVATGSSPSPLYDALAASSADFSNARWFALDEYVGLPPGHPESYAEVLRREIIEPLGLDPRTVHLPDPHGEDLQAACEDYEQRIAAAGGIEMPVNPECPASVLQLHGRVTVLADAAAASLLQPKDHLHDGQ